MVDKDHNPIAEGDWQKIRNMILTPEQYSEFEAIRNDMSDWVHRQPELASLTVGDANAIYARNMRNKLDFLISLYCQKENQGTLRLWCYKFYSV